MNYQILPEVFYKLRKIVCVQISLIQHNLDSVFVMRQIKKNPLWFEVYNINYFSNNSKAMVKYNQNIHKKMKNNKLPNLYYCTRGFQCIFLSLGNTVKKTSCQLSVIPFLTAVYNTVAFIYQYVANRFLNFAWMFLQI